MAILNTMLALAAILLGVAASPVAAGEHPNDAEFQNANDAVFQIAEAKRSAKGGANKKPEPGKSAKKAKRQKKKLRTVNPPMPKTELKPNLIELGPPGWARRMAALPGIRVIRRKGGRGIKRVRVFTRIPHLRLSRDFHKTYAAFMHTDDGHADELKLVRKYIAMYEGAIKEFAKHKRLLPKVRAATADTVEVTLNYLRQQERYLAAVHKQWLLSRGGK